MTDPPTLYHGTRKPFDKGGLVMPRRFHGGPSTTAPLRPGFTERQDSVDYVYVTPSKTVAWVYAWSARGRGRPRVLTVRPLSDVYYDPEHGPEMEAFRCTSAIVEAIDLDSPLTQEEVQGGWVDA